MGAIKLFLFSFFLIVSSLNYSSYTHLKKQYNGRVLIVLGYPANDDGTTSNVMKYRLDIALNICRDNKISAIVVTGGAVQNHYVEAEIMKKYLVSKGVPEKIIIQEKKAKSTFGNAINSRKILKKMGLGNPIIVTSEEHRQRAKKIFSYFFKEFSMAE